MTKKQLKDKLTELSKAELIELVLTLYGIKEAKGPLQAHFATEEELKANNLRLFQEAEEKIRKAFYPSRMNIAKGCVSKSTAAITAFKKECSDMDMLAELLVYQTELIALFMGGIEAELYYNSMVNTAERNARFLKRSGYMKLYGSRLENAAKTIGWDLD